MSAIDTATGFTNGLCPLRWYNVNASKYTNNVTLSHHNGVPSQCVHKDEAGMVQSVW